MARPLEPRPGSLPAPRAPARGCSGVLLLLLLLLAAGLGLSRPAAATLPPPPTDPQVQGVTAAAPIVPARLDELRAWLDYKERGNLEALPHEARIFYRRGLLAWRSGQEADGIRFVRGAGELDPWFISPHLSLAGWYLLREPSQALLGYATSLDLLREDFRLQLHSVGNLMFLACHGLFFGLLAIGLLLVTIHGHELRHMCAERLGRFLAPGPASVWAWVGLVIPYCLGFGLVLPTLLLLGLSWPVLKLRERALFVMLSAAALAAPFASHLVGPLASALRSEAAPFYGIPSLASDPPSESRRQELHRLALEHPGNPFLQFGLGWVDRRAGDLVGAEAAYRRALQTWPRDGRLLNNLGNIAATQGRFEDALVLYRNASAVSPRNAAPHFNSSQVHTRLFDYQAASEAVERASALDFELVKSYRDKTDSEGALPLADQWLAPSVFWQALLSPANHASAKPALPWPWDQLIETSGPWFSLATVAVLAVSLLLGWSWQRQLPLRSCSNCGVVVCRRCSERKREQALCIECAAEGSRAESPDFARVLLSQRRRRVERSRRLIRTAISSVVPGYGLISFRSVFGPLVLLSLCSIVISRALGVTAPIGSGGALALVRTGLHPAAWMAFGAVLYVLSLYGYLTRMARSDAADAAAATPVRSRVAQVTHLQTESEAA